MTHTLGMDISQTAEQLVHVHLRGDRRSRWGEYAQRALSIRPRPSFPLSCLLKDMSDPLKQSPAIDLGLTERSASHFSTNVNQIKPLHICPGVGRATSTCVNLKKSSRVLCDAACSGAFLLQKLQTCSYDVTPTYNWSTHSRSIMSPCVQKNCSDGSLCSH